MTQREVVLEGGVPWGFRMQGGADVNTPLRVSRVSWVVFAYPNPPP